MSDVDDTISSTKLTRTEFAVVRAYAQGMRPVDIANRYLADPDDDDALTESQAIARILTLRDRLVQFARQHDRPDVAEMFEALRGRSDVGMDRRVEALSSLEKLGQGRPLGSHEVGLWFGPSLARRLTAAGIARISDLAAIANARGSSWWRHVPRIGSKSANVITRWLIRQRATANDTSLSSVRPYVVGPEDTGRRAPMRPLHLSARMSHPVPLEHMDVSGMPPTGTHDETGAARLLSAIAADVLEVRRWLERSARSPLTRRSYCREAERLLLWSASKGFTLDGLDPTALRQYMAFLAAPDPATFWCGPASPRDREHWRPFEGPLGAASRQAAMRVVRALLNALHKSGYLRQRPVMPALQAAGASATKRHPDMSPGRPDESDIAAFLGWLEAQASSRASIARVAAWLVETGLTLGEITVLRTDAIRTGAAGPIAALAQGSGARVATKIRAIPDGVFFAIQAHWRDRGITDDSPSDSPLLGPLTFPNTARGLAKREAVMLPGYSVTGLDGLLRAAWKDYVRDEKLNLPKFTPGCLRRRNRAE